MGYYHFTLQPAEYESSARVRVSVDGGPDSGAVTTILSRSVLDRAAQALGTVEAADLSACIQATPAPAGSGPEVVLLARGPDRAALPRYLSAVVDAYRAELASRPSVPAAATPSPAVPAVDELAQINADRKRAEQRLVSVTREDLAAIQARLATNRKELDAAQKGQQEALRELTLIASTGPARSDRLAAMKALGITPAPAPQPPTESPAQIERLLTLQLKKAELGQRLGPEHRDMVALDEQIELVKSQSPKPAPVARGPDELDRHRAKREADRATFANRAAELVPIIEHDEAVLRAAAPLRAEIDRLAAASQAAAAKKVAAPVEPIAPATRPIASVEVVALATEGSQVAPVMARSVATGGLSGLFAGAGLGILIAMGLVRRSSDVLSIPRPVLVRPAPPAPVASVPASPPTPPTAPVVTPIASAPTQPVAESPRPAPAVVPTPASAPKRAVVPAPTAKLAAPTVPEIPVVKSGSGRVANPPRSARAGRGAKGKPEGPDLGVALLGQVPTIRTDLPVERKTVEGLAPGLVCFHRPNGPEAEAFRTTRRALASVLQDRGHQVILVSSPGPGDGKSTVAANLAISLAQSGKRAILVDCDLATPKVQELFRLNRLGDGIRSIMTAEATLRVAVRTCEIGNLFLLPAGRGPMDPVDMLTRPKFRELLAELKPVYEYVIIDGPPTTASRELLALSGSVDGGVLVVGATSDLLDRSSRGIAGLTAAGIRVLGGVANAATPRAEATTTPAPSTPATTEVTPG
jgi:capsular exopolysaccharide synthesis family protein